MEQMKIQAYSWQVHQPDIQCSGHLYQLSNVDIQDGEACSLSENIPFPYLPRHPAGSGTWITQPDSYITSYSNRQSFSTFWDKEKGSDSTGLSRLWFWLTYAVVFFL